MTDEKIIEIEVTDEDIEEMRSKGISEDELPNVGDIKRYRPARHIIKTKTPVLLDTNIVNHYKEKNSETYQTEINNELANIIQIKRHESSDIETKRIREELLNDEEFLRQLKKKLAA